MQGLRSVGGPHDAAVEPPLAVHEDAENDTAAATAGLQCYFSVEARVLTFRQYLDDSIGVMAEALGVGLVADLQR